MAFQRANGKLVHFMGFDQFYPHEEVPSLPNTDPFFEREPTVAEFIQHHRPTFRDVGLYFYKLFPFLDWIGKYNWTWFLGDVIAGRCALYFHLLRFKLTFRTGVTVGAVVVPQSMVYAQLARLEVQYGLYSSFMGVLIYWFFATSKDITIGVSYAKVMSLTPLTIRSSPSLSCPL